jgi:hypothetical protein
MWIKFQHAGKEHVLQARKHHGNHVTVDIKGAAFAPKNWVEVEAPAKPTAVKKEARILPCLKKLAKTPGAIPTGTRARTYIGHADEDTINTLFGAPTKPNPRGEVVLSEDLAKRLEIKRKHALERLEFEEQ